MKHSYAPILYRPPHVLVATRSAEMGAALARLPDHAIAGLFRREEVVSHIRRRVDANGEARAGLSSCFSSGFFRLKKMPPIDRENRAFLRGVIGLVKPNSAMGTTASFIGKRQFIK